MFVSCLRRREPVRPRELPVGRRVRVARGGAPVRMPRVRRHSRAGLRVRPQHIRERMQDANEGLPGEHQGGRPERPV